MQYMSAYPPQYMQANPMVLYPREMPMSYNQQFGHGAEDLLLAGQREAESRGRRRITRQQATVLENAFSENQKPNRNIRLELAQVLAISPRNVQVWFQNRRQKAKLLKKTVEQRTREVLEEATKQTEAEKAQRLQQAKASSQSPREPQRADSPSTPTRTRQNSSASTESTLTQTRENKSPYASPQEASYASLARSIAVAAAAAAVANGPASVPPTTGIPMLGHNPFFSSPMMTRSVSTFTECSTLDSSTPSYPGIPFDYPRMVGPLGETPLPSTDPMNIGMAQQFPDFAAAVDAHMLKRPATLLHPRQAEIANSEMAGRGRPALTRVNSCPAEFVDAFGNVRLQTPVVERPPQITLAAVAEQHTKKKRPRLSPLGVGMARSKSSMGVCQTATAAYFPPDVQQFAIPQPSPIFGKGTRSTPSSPVEGFASITPVPIAMKKDSPEKKTAFLSAEHVPLTPISPSGTAVANNQNTLNESPTLSLARAAGLTQLKKPQLAIHTEDIFSPPATPAHSLFGKRGISHSLADIASSASSSGVYYNSYDEQLSLSPSQFYIPEAPSAGMGNYAVDTGSMDEMFSMSCNSSQRQEMEDIDYSHYLAI